MKWRTFLGLLLALAACCQATVAKTHSPADLWLKVKIGPDSNACGITLPSATQPKGLPIVLWLHGGMRSRNTEKGWTAHRAALEWVAQEKAYFLSPSAFAGADWLSESGIRHIDGCLDYLRQHFPVQASPIWAIGVSDGTLGVIRYSLSGKYPLQRRVLISTYPDLALPANQVASHPQLQAGTWDVFVGGADRLFPAPQVVQACQLWSRQLKQFHLHFEPKGEHDLSWWMLNQKPQLVRALLGP
jgi:predicted esterase